MSSTKENNVVPVLSLYRWALNAKTGEKLVYHRGPAFSLPYRYAEEGHRANREGLVFLAQRPLSPGMYTWEATRITQRCAKLLGNLSTNRPLSSVQSGRPTHAMVVS